jgi:two-component system KDP operon response regulator KdpE
MVESGDGLILVIDDNLDTLNVIAAALDKAGYRVVKAENGFSGLETFLQHNPDLVILDVMMPGLNGWEVLQQLRTISTVPVIMLTVLGQERNIVHGLEKGADDYVAKPFSKRELLGRVHALLRRAQMPAGKTREPPPAAGDLVLVPEYNQVIKDGRTVKLTPVEFRLLSSLVRRGGAAVSSRQLLQEVWGSDYRADVRQLKVYIYYLRQKLEDDPSDPRYIITERGKGYRVPI